MALNLILSDTKQVLTAYATMIGAKPGSTALAEHKAFIASNGGVANGGLTNYAAALNGYFTGLTNAQMATQVLANLGLTGHPGLTVDIVAAALAGAGTNRVGAVLDWVNNFLAVYTGTDAALLAAKASLATSVDESYTYSTVAANTATTSLARTAPQIFTLSTSMDNLTGTAGNDTFNAYIQNNSNSLQSGDMIDGGVGTADTLFADIGNSQNFAITAQTTGIETVQIRGQAVGVDSSNNNLQQGTTVSTLSTLRDIAVQIDAQRMAGVTRWESNNSRADVIIEDVRIAANQITKDITIAFVESDPGNVDYGVYFNQLSLRNASSGSSSMNIFLMDTAAASAAATAATPLLSHNFNSYTFYSNNVLVTLGGAGSPAAATAIDNATTYAQLLAAFTLALTTANVGGVVTNLTGIVNASLSGPVNMTTEAAKSTTSAPVAASFLNLTGEILILSTASTAVITSTSTTPGAAAGGWIASGTAPSTGAIVQTFNSGTATSGALVTSKIILDDVGMGSTGGDLVVGGMSVNETSDSRGVERFEIEVLDNSRLQTINGTNNALREVTIINGLTSSAPSASSNTAYRTTTLNAGDLTVNGNVNTANSGTAIGTNSDTILKGVNSLTASATGNSTINPYTADHHSVYGFTDVRLIDASLMTGKLAFTAQITADSIAKYITLVDTQVSPTADVAANTGNANFNVRGANFAYTGGTNDDTMAVTIDLAATASRSNVVSGQSDFTFAIDGGAGNDVISVRVAAGGLTGDLSNWYNNQDLNNNITITAGAGNDRVTTAGAGDTTIDLGAGSDLVYTDNLGAQTGLSFNGATAFGISSAATTSKAVWVYNTTDQTSVDASIMRARNVNDLRSDIDSSTNLYKGTLFVTFKGLQSATITLSNTTSYKTTDSEINQAIKNAINTDATLKNLLVAKDGPGSTLVIQSLIDGTLSAADLAITLTAPTAAGTLTTTEVAGAAAAYGLAVGSTEAAVLTAMGTAVTAFNTKADYTTVMATDANYANIVGAASTFSSDNVITVGSGNDVVVLGTTVGTNLADSSNEVVVFTAAFDNDVIVNFNNGVSPTSNVTGVDHLNLGAFLDAAATFSGLGATKGSVVIAAEVTATNGTAALIKALVEAAAQPAVGTTTKQVYIAYSTAAATATDATNNVAKVYSIVNGNGATDAVVTLEGTIDLADTSWATLTVANFTVPAVSGLTSEGASSRVVSYFTAVAGAGNATLTGTSGVDVFSTNANTGATTMVGGLSGDSFIVTNLSTGANVITDLTTGDSLTVAGNGVVTANNVSAFIANAATSNTSTGAVTLNALASGPNVLTIGSTINVGLATGTAGYTINGSNGVDTLTGSAFADVIVAGSGADTISAGAGNDTITGGAGIDTIDAGAGNDSLVYLLTADLFTGNAVVDSIAGGAGTDVLTVGTTGTAFAIAVTDIWTRASSVETITAVANTATATITLDVSAETAGIRTVNISAVDTGAAGGNIVSAASYLSNGVAITGASAGGNTLTGGAGADTIVGGTLVDTITGGAGADTITGGTGTDIFNFTNASTGLPSATNFDTITDFAKAAEVISYTAAVLGTQVVAAASGVATITAGVATFNAADTTFTQHLTAVAAAVGATVNAGAIWQEGADTYMFISDATLGLSATDTLIKLTGVTTGNLSVVGATFVIA